MKKVFSLAAVFALVACLLAGCGGDGASGSGAVDPALEAKAKTALELAHEKDYGALTLAFREDLREGLTNEALAASFEPIWEQVGAFQEYKGVSSVTQDHSTLGAVTGVLLDSQYANQKIIWQVAFDGEGEMLSMTVVG